MSDETKAPIFDLDEAMAVLERTPAVLRAWRAYLPVLTDRETDRGGGS